MTPFLRTRWIDIGEMTLGTTANTQETVDLLKLLGDRPILSLRLASRGSVTMGTAPAFAPLSPIRYIYNRVEMWGTHRELGDVVHYRGRGTDLLYLTEHLRGQRCLRSVAANWAGQIEIPLSHPRGNGVLRSAGSGDNHPTYVDPRDYSLLTLRVTSGANVDFSSEASAVANLTTTIQALQVIDALPQGTGHLEPTLLTVEVPVESNRDRIAVEGIAGGYIEWLAIRALDNSIDIGFGTEIAAHPLGLVRHVRVEQAGQEIATGRFEVLRALTVQDFPVVPGAGVAPTSGADPRVGFVIIPFDVERDGLAMIDTTRAPLNVYLDSNKTPTRGVSGVTAAASDRAILTARALRPTPAYAALMSAIGAQAGGAE